MEDYGERRKIRTIKMSKLTRLYKECESKMVSRDNSEVVEQLYGQLVERFEQFKFAHLECLDMCTDSDTIATLEAQFDSSKQNFVEFRERYEDWIKSVEDQDVQRDDRRSQITSVARSSCSTQFKLKTAKVIRLKAELEMKKLEEKQKLERARQEIEMEEQVLEKRNLLEQARVEELVWQETCDEQNQNNEYKLIDNEHRNSVMKPNINLFTEPGYDMETESQNRRRTEEEQMKNRGRTEEVTLTDSKVSSVESAFQTLASTLYEGFNLPKPELLTFDGKAIDYSKFIKNFESNIENRVNDNRMKLSYLIQYCKGEAKSAIEDCVLLESEEGYKRAKGILYSRYGRPHVIARSYIDKLVDGPQIKGHDLNSLSTLALDMQKCEITLSQLGFVSDIDNSDNLRKIVKRLPIHLRVKWVDVAHSITETGREPRFPDLARFINNKSRVASSMYSMDLIRERSETKTTYKPNIEVKGRVSSFAMNHVNSNINSNSNVRLDRKCFCCNGTCTHLESCNRFKSMSLADRFEHVSKRKLCFNCLGGKHFVINCKKDKNCSVETCNFKHHKLLHKWVKQGTDHTATKVSINCSSADAATKNCLGIIPVIVTGSSGKTCKTYALIDDGADKTLCDERLIHMLELKSKPVTFKITTAASKQVHQTGSEVDLQLQALEGDKHVNLKHVWSVKNLPISTKSAATHRDIRQFTHLSDIYIPEIKIDDVLLLVGTDTPEVHIPLEVRSGGSNDPYAIRTRLGWIVRGPVRTHRHCDSASINFRHSENDLLHQQLERLWTTDFNDIRNEKTCMSVEDKKALKTMESTTKYEDGHYKLGLPWSDDDVKLPNNLPLAHARLQQLIRKLSKDDKLHKMYTATMNDYIDKGYAKEVKDVASNSGRVWYLPHHPVTNEHKPGKIRVVFDCAAKYKDVSLNNMLLQGPDLMNNLVGVLLRFRQDHIAVAADVEAMFHQVRVKNEDCDALRFLWWPDGNLKLQPKCYKMQVHLFGATSSPSCAAYALKRTAVDNAMLFNPDVISTVDRNFYVDDLLKSVDTEEKACELASDLQKITKLGGFRLTKWMSNSKTVINTIPDSERTPSVADLKTNTALPTDRALGVTWDVDNDAIKYRVKLDSQPTTRRGITSTLSSIFDPLGLIAPIIFKGKLILQSLSKQSSKLGWDDIIPDKKKEEWFTWKSSLHALENISIQRCFKDKDMKNISNAQLHIFSDGSEDGYGACAYLRLVDTDGNVNCSLVLGKARLAPLKQITIPRLELSGAVVACRLYEFIREELDIEIDDVTFWTDSMILLGYIKNESRRFKTFVANRLSVIHDLTSPEQWRYVDTKTNPADIASRGIAANDTKRLEYWFHGPSFLSKENVEWPNYKTNANIEESDVELKKNAEVYSISTNDTMTTLMSYFSDWKKLRRSVGWLLRFKKYCISRFLCSDRQFDTGRLTLTELQAATKAILVYTQRETFGDEIAMLEKQNQVNKNSRLASLNPVIHDDLLKVKGRLDLSESLCPIILSNSHHVTTLIIRSFHECNGHTGMAQVLASLREKYWILKGPSTVRKVIQRCTRCRRYQAPLCSQKMAPIIEDQKTPDKPPFTFVGTDYFGPITVKIGRSLVKRYGCLFTCLTTRAVHIEIAHSLTTDSFISAFQRFISRRGYPEKVYSDNGTNFVGGVSELKKTMKQWNDANISSYMSNRNINWTFNPPNASHRGGAWERMIRSTRKILISLTNEQTLTDEKLLTFMAEAERVINDRPLTQVSNDPRDLSVLTPSMLLLMKTNTAVPQGVYEKEDIYAKRWYKQIQYLADIFWRRWLREYLPILQPRNKWQREQRDIKVDDLVLIADEHVRRGMWPMGRVIDVVKSRDGHIRSCVVKTGKTQISRPITKLCLLESESY